MVESDAKVNIFNYIVLYGCAIMGVLIFGKIFRYLQDYGDNLQQERWQANRHSYPLAKREHFQSQEGYDRYIAKWQESENKKYSRMQSKEQWWHESRWIHRTMRIACVITMFAMLALIIYGVRLLT